MSKFADNIEGNNMESKQVLIAKYLSLAKQTGDNLQVSKIIADSNSLNRLTEDNLRLLIDNKINLLTNYNRAYQKLKPKE